MPKILIVGRLLLLSSIFLNLFLISCSTAPVQKTASDKPVRLSADLYIDEVGKSSYKVKATIVLLGQTIRADLITTTDVPLASILMTPESVRYALYQEKKFYQGVANPHALDPVFPLAVSARELSAILDERKISGQTCEVDSQGVLMKCQGQSPVPHEVEWTKRGIAGPLAGRATKVTIKLPTRKVELKFYLTNIEKNVSDEQRLLTLVAPQNFSVLPVPTK